jgi:hypothetical protein
MTFFSLRGLCREAQPTEKVTEKVVEDVDNPVVAPEETETAAPVEEVAVTEEETPAVESSDDAVEVTENGNGEAEKAEPVVEEAGKFDLSRFPSSNISRNSLSLQMSR